MPQLKASIALKGGHRAAFQILIVTLEVLFGLTLQTQWPQFKMDVGIKKLIFNTSILLFEGLLFFFSEVTSKISQGI